MRRKQLTKCLLMFNTCAMYVDDDDNDENDGCDNDLDEEDYNEMLLKV